jgi:chromosome segregation protein
VRGPEALARRLGQIGVVADTATGNALQASLRPGQRLVSREGALWRWDGYRRAAAAATAAAMRLKQRNRLAELVIERTAADAETARADDALAAAKATQDHALSDRAARDAVSAAFSAVARARERQSRSIARRRRTDAAHRAGRLDRGGRSRACRSTRERGGRRPDRDLSSSREEIGRRRVELAETARASPSRRRPSTAC